MNNNFTDFRSLCTTFINMCTLKLTILDPLKPSLPYLVSDTLPNLATLKLTFPSMSSRQTYHPLFDLMHSKPSLSSLSMHQTSQSSVDFFADQHFLPSGSLTRLSLNLSFNIADEVKQQFFKMLPLRNPKLLKLGLPKCFLKGYRPQPPEVTFMAHLSYMQHLQNVTIHPVKGEYPETPELSLIETGNILDALVKKDVFKCLKKFKMSIDKNPSQQTQGQYVSEDDKKTLFKKVVKVVKEGRL